MPDVQLLQGDCLALLRTLPAASVDACVTDPPYELGFMSKTWDRTGIANNVALWREVARVLKPGGHLLAFGGSRTYHRMVCAIEDAGLEIRDSLHWVYGSGFPKSHDVSKALDKAAGAERPDAIKGGHRGINVHGDPPNANALGTRIPHEVNGGAHSRGTPATDLAQQWAGWGTALKPAHEPIVLARKPLAGTVAATVAAYGTGALNIAASRVQAEPGDYNHPGNLEHSTTNTYGWARSNGTDGAVYKQAPPHDAGRWPPNVLLTHAPGCNGVCAPGCPVAVLDAQSGERPNGYRFNPSTPDQARVAMGKFRDGYTHGERGYADTGGASRFYPVFTPDPPAPFLYCAKASRRERNAGCVGLPERDIHRYGAGIGRDDTPTSDPERPAVDRNFHPTVKPQALMRWLCTLITPPGGTILDPFCGSGSTGVAAVTLGYGFIGCEEDAAYLAIAAARLAHAQAQQPAAVQPALLPEAACA